MKKITSFLLALIIEFSLFPMAYAHDEDNMDIVGDAVPSAILIEAETGEIIFQKDAYSRRSPASVTKIMTMLLAAEAVEKGVVSLDESVVASARAASMGGSQIWLEEGEAMSFGEMLKCIAVVSANDCCVAIAEHLAGSEEAFVARMNEKAISLGLENSNFVCCSGLSDSDEHYSCAYDLAMISRELLRYDFIRKFTTTWTDSIRNGEFILNNTNKLVYHFPDTTGLKTGFTSKAGHCLAASARREETEFIAVVLSCESSASRFEGAKSLLNYAFSNYTLISVEELCSLPPIKVEMGKADCINGVISDKNILIKKDIESALSCLPQLPEKISAPIENGQKLGTVKIMSDNVLIKEIDVISEAEIASMAYFDLLRAFLASLQNFLVINAEL